MINAIEAGEIKVLFNMGEDIAHIHPNQTKIHSALKKLDLLVVSELFDNEITKYADIVYGVKSAYEKTGVYVNAERRLHLSQLKLSKRIKKGTLFTTFHHAKSKINFLFGDECDELTKTARFKSVKVIVE